MAAKERFSEANAAFVEEDYRKAVELYTKAIEDDAKDDYYAARAHVRIKLGDYTGAVCDATKAIELNSNNVKSYLRKGIAQFHLEQFQNSTDTLKTGQAMDDSDLNFAQWIRKCEAEIDLRKKQSENEDSKQVMYGCSSCQSSETQAKSLSATVQAKSSINKDSQEVKPAVAMPSGPKVRFDWYQTDTHVVVTVLIKNVKKEDLQTDIEDKSLGVMIKLPSGSDYSLQLDLSHTVVPAQCQVKIYGTKVEIKLKKADGVHWNKLEGDAENPNMKHFKPAKDSTTAVKYPSSSHYTRDWDKIVTEIKKEEKDEKLEGDAAVNQLFQQIYADGNEDVRRAMNKSFVESGGTVLSTNWKEIGNKKTDVKPPDGMEYKEYS